MGYTYTCQMCGDVIDIMDQAAHIMSNHVESEVVEASYQVRVYYSDGTDKLAHDSALSYGMKEVKEIRKSIRNFKRGKGFAYVTKIVNELVDPYALPTL